MAFAHSTINEKRPTPQPHEWCGDRAIVVANLPCSYSVASAALLSAFSRSAFGAAKSIRACTSGLGTTAPLVVGALPTNLNLTRLPRRRFPPESFPRDVDPLAHGGPGVATTGNHNPYSETTLAGFRDCWAEVLRFRRCHIGGMPAACAPGTAGASQPASCTTVISRRRPRSAALEMTVKLPISETCGCLFGCGVSVWTHRRHRRAA